MTQFDKMKRCLDRLEEYREVKRRGLPTGKKPTLRGLRQARSRRAKPSSTPITRDYELYRRVRRAFPDLPPTYVLDNLYMLAARLPMPEAGRLPM